MKYCRSCKQEHPLTDFHKDKRHKDGLCSTCKACRKLYYISNNERIAQQRKRYYKENKEKYRQYNKENSERIAQQRKMYYQENKEHLSIWKAQYYQKNKQALTIKAQQYICDNTEYYLLCSTRANAKITGRTHSITIADIIIPEACPYLGVPLTRTRGKGSVPTNPSIDRIDSTKGYAPGNIQVISRLANLMKSNATKDQLITFAKNILKIYPIDKGV